MLQYYKLNGPINEDPRYILAESSLQLIIVGSLMVWSDRLLPSTEVNSACLLANTWWYYNIPDSKIHGANMGPRWGWQDPGGPHVGHMNLAIWDRNTPGTLMMSAAAHVINHNGRKIIWFKPIQFCYVRMTSAQLWSWRHHWFEPTLSLQIFKQFYLVIYKTLALIFPVQLKEC